VKPEQLRLAVARIMLTRFRLGEFDQPEGGGLPWEVDESLIDSAMHRGLAREAAAASVVLATNRCDKATRKCALPVVAERALAGNTIAVLGPFANCSDAISGGWAKTNCYLHSYV
jgi:beta-glucosidase-like glycosyl hydrolase